MKMNRVKRWFIGDYLAKTDDVFERARIELVFAFSMFFFVLGLGFYINIIVHHYWLHMYAITFAAVSLGSIPFVLKYWQNVRLAAIWYVVQQFIVSIAEASIQNFAATVQGTLFVTAIIMFCFFMFGRRWGFIYSLPFLVIFLLGIASDMAGHPLIDMHAPADQQLSQQPILALMPLALNIFVMYKFISTRAVAEQQIRNQKSQLEEKNKEVTDSIVYAQRIQRAILPSHRLIENYLPQSFVVFLPKDIVSGDFYWTEKKGSRVYFAVADCTGHGVPGAMVSVIGQNALNRVVNEFNIMQPAAILDKLNELVEEAFAKSGTDVRDGMDIALCCFDSSAMALQYAGANNPLYHVSGSEISEIKGNKQPIGRFETKVPFRNHELKLKAGDSVYVFSDGIADQFGGPDGKKFKYKRVKELFLRIHGRPKSEQKNEVISAFSEWKGKLEQIDDVCVMGIGV
jgi:serine phosphatase RsbU (regulator of sigma subunit)